jgi:hypothetical protein
MRLEGDELARTLEVDSAQLPVHPLNFVLCGLAQLNNLDIHLLLVKAETLRREVRVGITSRVEVLQALEHLLRNINKEIWISAIGVQVLLYCQRKVLQLEIDLALVVAFPVEERDM